jgi:hypothetical protein
VSKCKNCICWDREDTLKFWDSRNFKTIIIALCKKGDCYYDGNHVSLNECFEVIIETTTTREDLQKLLDDYFDRKETV